MDIDRGNLKRVSLALSVVVGLGAIHSMLFLPILSHHLAPLIDERIDRHADRPHVGTMARLELDTRLTEISRRLTRIETALYASDK